MGLFKGVINLVAAIASFFVLLLAVAIVVYTATKLADVDYSVENIIDVDITEDFCALGNLASNITIPGTDTTVNVPDTSSVSSSNCLLLEILGGITIGLALIITIIQCYTLNLCGLGGILDFIFALLGSAAWLGASIVVTQVYSDRADDGQTPEFQDERQTVMIMCWVEFGLFCSIVVAALMKCCACCGCGGGKSSA